MRKKQFNTTLQIARNVIANWGNHLISCVIGFFMMPFIISHLGDGKYGIWVLMVSLTGYLGFLDLGISGSLVKYIAEFKSKGDLKSLVEYSNSIFSLFLVIGIIATLVTIIFVLFLIGHFNIPASSGHEARYVGLLMGLSIALSLPFGFFSGYLRGLQRYDLIAVVQTLIYIPHTILIIASLSLGYGIVMLSFIHLFSKLVDGIILIILFRKLEKHVRLRLSLPNRRIMRLTVNYSIYLLLYDFAQRAIFYSDSLIIGYFENTASITHYAIGSRLLDYLRMLIILMVGVLAPTVSSLASKDEFEKIRKILVIGTKYSLLLSMPIGVIYFLLGESFIKLWIGDGYHDSYLVLMLLTIPNILTIGQLTAFRVLLGLGKHKIAAYIGICQAIGNVILSVVLVQKYGIVGVAIATAISMVFGNALLLPIYTCKLLSISLIRYVGDATIKVLINLVPFVLFVLIIKSFVKLDSWGAFIVCLMASFILYFVSSSFLCFSKDERRLFVKNARAVIRI